MGRNTKPMLTVLVEGDKLQQFRDYALSKEVSMGWVVNRLLDRLLSGELDVMTDSPSRGTSREVIEHTSTGLTREDIEEMIKTSIEQSLDKSSTDITQQHIEEMIKTSIEQSLDKPSTDITQQHIEEMIKTSIKIALEPIESEVEALKKPLAIG